MVIAVKDFTLSTCLSLCLSTSGCLFERKLCTGDQFCSDGEYNNDIISLLNLNIKLLRQTTFLRFSVPQKHIQLLTLQLDTHIYKTYSIHIKHADAMTVYENIRTRVKDFSSLSPCVYLSLSFSVTCPSPLSSSLSKPLLRPTVSMATLTSQ